MGRETVLATNCNDGMQVIGHHDMRIDLDIVVVDLKALQVRLSDLAKTGKVHLTVHDVPEDTVAIARADGDEIPAAGAIVPVAEAGRLDPVFA